MLYDDDDDDHHHHQETIWKFTLNFNKPPFGITMSIDKPPINALSVYACRPHRTLCYNGSGEEQYPCITLPSSYQIFHVPRLISNLKTQDERQTVYPTKHRPYFYAERPLSLPGFLLPANSSYYLAFSKDFRRQVGFKERRQIIYRTYKLKD